jgi:RNA polymerase sigma-70 factor (ECF subfamily)
MEAAGPMSGSQRDEGDARLAALMQAAQQGDSRAYARLLGDLAPILRRFIRSQRRFLDAADVEDLVQEVLLSLHSVRATYDPGRPFMPWVAAIARNRLADGARKYRRRAAHEVQVDQLPVTFADDAANTTMDGPGDPEALRRAVQALPKAQRQAIEMLKLKELSLREASAVTGMTVGALKISVHRAMGSLRRVLQKA